MFLLTVVLIGILTLLNKQSICVDLCDEEINSTDTYYNATSAGIQVCHCNLTGICIRKCCKPGYFLSHNRICRKHDAHSPFKLPLYFNKREEYEYIEFPSNFSVGMVPCPVYKLTPSENPTDKFFVQKDGYIWQTSIERFIPSGRFCIDSINKSNEDLVAYICLGDAMIAEIKTTVIQEANTLGMIISMPFLLTTFVVYLLLPDRNLHMKALMFYVLSLFLGYVFLVSIQLASKIPEDTCIVLGLAVVFFFMLSFFWMNVICVDIWFTFSGLRGFHGSKRTAEKKRFIIYCVYAWGMAILHVLIVFIINKFGEEYAWYHPGVGLGQCFLRSNTPQLLYFYGPMGILITINVVLFVLTAIKIRQAKRDTEMLRKDDSKRHSYENDKQKFNLYLKLLLAMGINWTLELISWAVDWQLGVSSIIWYIPDFCNAIYGVFIFFLFVFKRKIWVLLQKRYYVLSGRPHLAQSATSNPTQTSNYSTTETGLPDVSRQREEIALRTSK